MTGLINYDTFSSRFVGNTIWLIAVGYYIYITFLGYTSKYTNLVLQVCHEIKNSLNYLFSRYGNTS